MPINPDIQSPPVGQFDGGLGAGLVKFDDLQKLPRSVVVCVDVFYFQNGGTLDSVLLLFRPKSTGAEPIIEIDKSAAEITGNSLTFSFTVRGIQVPRDFTQTAPEDGKFADLQFFTIGKSDGEGTLYVAWRSNSAPERTPGIQATTVPREPAS